MLDVGGTSGSSISGSLLFCFAGGSFAGDPVGLGLAGCFGFIGAALLGGQGLGMGAFGSLTFSAGSSFSIGSGLFLGRLGGGFDASLLFLSCASGTLRLRQRP
ncbi:hypothetical protein [Brevundimonas sp.]|uniref:hypothetical protein n=1 Tax=Brevundimonas sp. TaxID=1871086 RepID=UPI0028AFCAEC|nr:hypothetical protein [Brevundimonas sp.]